MESWNDLIEYAAERFGGRTLAVDAEDDATLSFEGLKRGVERVAANLAGRLGVKPGERVALLMPNGIPCVLAYLGILRAGAVALPVNVRLKAEEIKFILSDAQACALFVHKAVWKQAEQALKEVPSIRSVIACGMEPPGAIPFSEMAGGDAPPPTPPLSRRSDVAAIIYTSGTTGRPKGAMITHGNILFNARSCIAGLGFRGSDTHLLIVPLFHVTGLNTILPTAVLQGGRLVISAKTDPEQIVETISRYRPTTFLGVPTTFYLLTAMSGLDTKRLASLRKIAYSGAPMSPQAIRTLREMFPNVELHNFFGLTETTSITSVLPNEDALAKPESVGPAVPGVRLKIVDAEGRTLPAGATGELCIQGECVVAGYLNRPDATKDAIRDGWLHTGDLAVLDGDGCIFLKGRSKEMIIVAGENVYPIEVEMALCAHPKVREAAVYGRPHKVLGEAVHAAVVLRPGEKAGEPELKKHASDRLASFKVPLTIRILDALPRNPSGKVVKRALAE